MAITERDSHATILNSVGLGAQARGFAETALSRPREPSPVDEINGTLESARNLAGAIQVLANEICGRVPESCGTAIKDVGDGIINDMAYRSSAVADEIQAAHGALSRLRAAFGI